jgi:hypothetical protein
VINRIETSLRAWRADGSSMQPRELIQILSCDLKDYPIVGGGGAWQSARIILVDVVLDLKCGEEQSEQFFQTVSDQFLDAGAWLSTLDSRVIKRNREPGLMMDVIIEFWIDSNQLELQIPPFFLQRLGELGLALQLVSND